MILVTGATGTIGGELVGQLIDACRPVRVLVRDARKVASIADRVHVAVGDLDRPETLPPALQGVKAVFLVTFETSQDANMIEAARRAGVRHIVKLSTLEASQAVIRIGKWSRERELLIERSGIEWTFLRPGMFMSNSIDWWAETIRDQSAVYFPGGKGQVAPVSPRDIAAVAALALTQPGHAGHAYELTGSELMTIGDMVQTLGRVLGKPIRYTDVPPLAAGLWMVRSGMSLTLLMSIMELLASLRRGDGAVATDTVQRLLGRPPITFETWCREHAAAFQPMSDSIQAVHS